MTTSHRPARRAAHGVLALLLAASIVSCSSDDGSDGDADRSTTTEAAAVTTDDLGSDEVVTDDVDTDDIDTGDLGTDEVTTDDGEVGSDAQAYVDALVGTFDEDDGQFYTKDQVNCLAEGFVDVIGLDTLQDAGVSPQEFADSDGTDFPDELGVDEGKANEMYDQFEACDIDLTQLFSSFGGSDLTAEEQACLDRTLTDEALRASFVAGFLGEELDDDPLDAASECIDSGPTAETPASAPSPTAATVVPE